MSSPWRFICCTKMVKAFVLSLPALGLWDIISGLLWLDMGVPVVHVDPVPQQELGLLEEAGGVLELPGLGGVGMEQSLMENHGDEIFGFGIRTC